MNNNDVFISFSFENQEVVNDVVNELTNKYGISCWLCLDKVSEGQSYKEKIPEAIDHSSTMVVFISKDSVVSEQVPKEVGMAFEAGKTVIPFRLDGAKYQGRLRYDLQDVNYIDATIPTFEERIYDLAKAICFAANKPFCVEDAPDNKPEASTVYAKNGTSKESDKTSLKKEKTTTAKEFFINLINVIVASPVCLSVLNDFYPDIYTGAPSFLKGLLSLLCNKWFLLVYYIAVFVIAHHHFSNFDYQKKRHSNSNIDTEFSDSFQNFINLLTSLSNANLPLKQKLNPKGYIERFAFSYDFEEIQVGSFTGEKVDYFSVLFPSYTNPFCRFFYIGRYTSKRNAIKYLLKQGFDFCGKRNDILHFCKDGDLHLRLAYRNFVFGIVGLEVTRGGIKSVLEERINHEYVFFSPIMVIRGTIHEFRKMIFEYRQGSKKDKIVFWVFVVNLSLLLVGLLMKYLSSN